MVDRQDDQMSFVVVGFRFYGCTPEVMNTGMITLQRDPTNEYDRNAIKVLVNGGHVGYVSKDHCVALAKMLHVPHTITVTSVYNASVECRISKKITEPQ